MDFSDLIKISRVDNVILHRPFEGPMQKALGITGHHLILSSLNEKVEEIMVSMVCCILHVPAYLLINCCCIFRSCIEALIA